MKKSLLLLGAALLMTASAMAQTYTNAREKSAPPAFSDANAYNYAGEQGGDTLYLWNVKHGGFYTNHRDPNTGAWPYGTRASVNDTIGSKIVFTHVNPGTNADVQSEDEAFFQENPEAYLLVSYVSKFDGYYCTFADWFDGIWTDNNTTNNRYFVPYVAGSYLRIHPTGNLRNELPADWSRYNFCVRPTEMDTWRCVYFDMEDYVNPETGEPEGIPAGEDVGLDWAIVSPTVYDTWIVASKAQNALFTLGNQLADALNKAVADCDDTIRPMLAAQIAVLNNLGATAEELQAAISQIGEIVVTWGNDHATPDNPANLTAKIVNPSFDVVGDFHGWSGSGWGAGGQTSTCAENYKKTFDTYQDIEGLQEGVYKVVLDGFARIQDNHETDWVEYHKGTQPFAKVYVASFNPNETDPEALAAAQVGYESPFKPSSAGASTERFGTGNVTEHNEEGVIWYAPNSMLGFVDFIAGWAELGQRPYGTQAFGALEAGQTLRIGAREKDAGEWVIADNFELWYLGNSFEAYKLWGEEVKEIFPTYDFEGDNVYYGKPEKDFYTTVYNKLYNAATKEDIIYAAKTISQVIDTLTQSFDVYNQFVAEVDGFQDWLAENKLDQTTSEFARLEVYMDQYEDIEPGDGTYNYPNGSAMHILSLIDNAHEGTLSVEQMKAELDFIAQLKTDALDAGMVKGANLTSLIVNPDFDKTPAGTGWTMGYNQTGNNNLRGGKSSNYCAEVWSSDFDLYQDIESPLLREGLYRVSVRAFQRTGGNDAAWQAWLDGSARVTTEVYLNEFHTPVANLQSVQYANQLGNAVSHDVEGTSYYTLNNMDGSSDAFSLADSYGLDVMGNPDPAYFRNYDPSGLLRGKVMPANFKQDVYGIIEEAGSLRLGIRSYDPAQIGDRWSLWDKFELFFMGYDVEGVQFVMKDYVERADDFDVTEVGSDDWDVFSGMKDDIEPLTELSISDLKNKGYDDITYAPVGDEDAYDSKKLYDKLITFIAAYQRVVDSNKAYLDFQDKITEVADLYNQLYMDIPVDLANEIDNWIADNQDNNEGTLKDFEAGIAKGDEYITKMNDSTIDWGADLPIDLTSFIKNPRYESNNNDGWSGTTPGFQSYMNAEVFQNTFDHYQTINVTRPGYYLLTVRAFERIGYAAEDWTVFTGEKASTMYNAVMYATVGDQTYEHHIGQLARGAVTTEEQANFAGSWQDVGEGLHVADNMQGASSFFYWYENEANTENTYFDESSFEIVVKDQTAGYYYNPLLIHVAEAGPVTIGLKKPTRSDNSGDWCCWADWKFWYYGNDDSVLTGVNEVTNSNTVAAPVQRSIFNTSGAKVQTLQRGINIVKTVDAEGNVRVQKILVK